MIINTLQDHIATPLHRAALYSFEKVSLCARGLFSFMKEEGSAWKGFLSNNYLVSKISTLGSVVTDSIGKKLLNSDNDGNSIHTSNNTGLDQLKANNEVWIRDHSLFHKKHPDFNVSREALLDVIFSKDIDNKGVIEFAKKFCFYTGNTSLKQSISSWEKACQKHQQIEQVKDQPKKIEKIARELAQKVQSFKAEKDHIVLAFEKQPSTSNLSYYVEYGFNQLRSIHHDLYETVNSKIKEQLQKYLTTNWKKKLFTEIQEEIRLILLNQYSSLHQKSTLGHTISSSLPEFLSGNLKVSTSKESLSGMIWDLLLQNGINDEANEPISEEKLNQIFDKEFVMINSAIENTTISGINQLVDKAGEGFLQPLLQIWHNQLPHKERGWLEIRYQSDTHCQINLYARDREKPVHNIAVYKEPSPMKVYSYHVPKDQLQAGSFLELLSANQGEKKLISDPKALKEFLSGYGKLIEESYIPSSSKIESHGLLDHIKMYHVETSESSVESPEKTFFQMRFHAFINYCKSIEHNKNISDETLANVENGITTLLEAANNLYDAGEISDDEYIGIISTGLEIETSVVEKQHSWRDEVQSSEIIVPTILKEQIRNMFVSSGISQVDVENIKSFAKVLLGSDMSEEIALLCKELPIATEKQSSLVLPHTSLWKTLKKLFIDVKNLRTSPVAVFRVYSDVRKLISNLKSIIALVSYIPYIYLVVACCTNPVTAVACLVGGAIVLYMLFNMPELEPVLNVMGSIFTFQKEVYNFLLTRLILRGIQVADIAFHWNEIGPMKVGRSLLAENLSNEISFSLHAPLDPDLQGIPKELMPLQKFHPDMEVWADPNNEQEISNISFPKLSMELHIQERNGIKRAYLQGQPGFWLAEVITDRKLESLDFAHLLLENEKGDKKVCVVPRSEGRLILQTVLRMGNAYSRKSVDMLSSYIRNKMLKNRDIVYYYDLVDGELASLNGNAISYLITHYITSGDTARSQKLVDQLKQMKINRLPNNPNTPLNTLEQISSVVPNSMNCNLEKIILELSSLCTEIPIESKAFPLFLRAYQNYIASKQTTGKSYLSEDQEVRIARHIKDSDKKQQILNGMGNLALATQPPWIQTLLLLGSNIMDVSVSKFLGKENYIPACVKNYDLERQYLQGEKNPITLLMGLMLNSLINPHFSTGSDLVNMSKVISKNGINIFEQLPLIISKLNKENSTLKSDYPVVLLLILAFLRQCESPSEVSLTESIKQNLPILQGAGAVVKDMLAASLTDPTNAFKFEEKFSGLIQTLASYLLENENLYSVEKSFVGTHPRHIIQSGITTLQNFAEINNKYKKQKLLHDQYTSTFPSLQLGNDYQSLKILEQSIEKVYQKITKDFLKKEDRSSNMKSSLNIQDKDSAENHIMNIVNWYQDGKDRGENTSFYTLQDGKTKEDFVNSLNQAYQVLQEDTLKQEKTIEYLLGHRLQDLSLLTDEIRKYTNEVKIKSTGIRQAQEEISRIYSTQSTIKKIGTGLLKFINTFIETPTLGYVQLFKNVEIEQLSQQKKNLLEESKSIKSKRKKVFENIITAFKPETSLGLQEVYNYFCEGKDALIIGSLGLDENQWKILKEQLYRYMILQRHLSIAENLDELSKKAVQDPKQNIDLIGHQLDPMFHSEYGIEELEMSLRSRLQFEKQLGKALSPDLRNKVKN